MVVAAVAFLATPRLCQAADPPNLPDPAAAAIPGDPAAPFRLQLDFHYMYGEADGSIQTPSGGEPGTTSANRPSLSEIGIDHVRCFDFASLITDKLSIEASAWWGLPIDKTAQITTLDLVGKYQLWGNRNGSGGAAYLGVAFETLEYEDNQTVPNHINVDFGPLLIAGLQVRF
jgi:hypothetical protein